MGKVGHQDFWRVGSKFYFQRDGTNRLQDLGVISSVNATKEIEEVSVEDPDGGVNQTVEEGVTSITETFEIETKNLASRNLALAYLASTVSEWTQTKTDKLIQHAIEKGFLAKIHDSDSELTGLQRLASVAGIMSAAPASGVLSTVNVTAIDAATRTLTTASDVSSDLADGDLIILRQGDMTNPLNSRTYTVASASGTSVVVDETPVGDESSVTAQLIYIASGDSGTIYAQDIDWEIPTVGLDRGHIRILESGSIATGNVFIAFTTAAVTGEEFSPQTDTAVEGNFELFFSRDSFAREDVRFGRCSIRPNAENYQIEDASTLTLTVTVLRDATKAVPLGKFRHIKGTNPDKS